MGNRRFSDYATQYWDVADWRRCYPCGASLPQMKKWLDHVVFGRAPYLPPDRPQLLLVSICGPWYGEGGAGREFTDPHDLRQFLDGQNNTDVTVTAQVMYAAARGMAGVRCYSFDSPLWKAERGNGQTGSDPLATGTNRWAGLSAAFNLIGQLEPYVLGQPLESPDLGEDVAVGARQTDRGRLLIAVNFSEVPHRTKVDLTGYRYEGAPELPLVRYRLHGATLSTESLPPQESHTVDFRPGEAILWLLRARSAASGQADPSPPSVWLTQPLPNAIVQGEITIAASAADELGVARVDLLVDGQPVGKVTAPPYQLRLDTSTLTPHVWHSLTAVAYNAAGQRSEARQMFQVD
jgi:hypothetical protein